MEKTVYFFGAGTTKAFAPTAPLNNDLVKKALEDFPNDAEAKDVLKFISEVFSQRLDPPVDNTIWNFFDSVIQSQSSASKNHDLERVIALKKSLLNLVLREFDKQLNVIDTQLFSDFVQKQKAQIAQLLLQITMLFQIVRLQM